MNRQPPYPDARVNRYAPSQLPQIPAQRMQQNAQINDFHGQPQFPSRAEGQQQWDTTPQIELNPMSPHSYTQGRKGKSQERMPNQKFSYENQAINDPRLHSHEQDMEIGYVCNTRLTHEGLELRFQDEIMKLIKEQSNAEDEENARHKERIVEINTQYQENPSSLRVRHASRVGEFLQKESHTRLHHYQQQEAAMTSHLPERSPTDARDYGWAMGPDAHRHRPYGAMPYMSQWFHILMGEFITILVIITNVRTNFKFLTTRSF